MRALISVLDESGTNTRGEIDRTLYLLHSRWVLAFRQARLECVVLWPYSSQIRSLVRCRRYSADIAESARRASARASRGGRAERWRVRPSTPSDVHAYAAIEPSKCTSMCTRMGCDRRAACDAPSRRRFRRYRYLMMRHRSARALAATLVEETALDTVLAVLDAALTLQR